MARKRIILSWSSGKDSAWSLYLLSQREDIEIVGLLTSFNKKFDRVAMHATRREIVLAQADAAGLPLFDIALPWPCTNAAYERAFNSRLSQLKNQYHITHIAFGDLFLEDIRHYRESQVRALDLEPFFPIWGLPTDELAQTMIKSGLSAIITCLDPKKLPASFAGRHFDQCFLDDLPDSVDPCGENGEFHTYTYQGPMFANVINVAPGETLIRDKFVFSDLVLSPHS